MKHTFGSSEAFVKSNVVDADEMDLPTIGDPGMGNFLYQAMGYTEDKCAPMSEFFLQRIAGGLCQTIGDGSSQVKSQLLGCTPPSDPATSSKFTINMVQFESINCTGEPFQVVSQFHDENDCAPVSDDSSPYKTSMNMKCVVPGSSDDSFKRGAFATGYYSPNDSTCESASLVQSVLTNTCMKGTTTDDKGITVPSNTSTTITCASKSEYVVHIYNQRGCTGDSMKFPQTIEKVDCTPGKRSNGDLVYEKQICVNPQQ